MHNLFNMASKHHDEIIKNYREMCQLAIETKFASEEWRLSPLRNFKYVKRVYSNLSRPRIEDVVDGNGEPTGETKCYTRFQWTGADNIREMIRTRDLKAKTDPYAHWDYVTCTLSRAEMLRLARWLDKNPCVSARN